MSFLQSIFEGGQHQSVANQQLPKSVDSLHKTCNSSTPDLFSSATIKSSLGMRDYHIRYLKFKISPEVRTYHDLGWALCQICTCVYYVANIAKFGLSHNRWCHTTDGPPPIGLPGPHATVMDGPPGPCTATTVSLGGPSTALSITTVGPPLPRIVPHCCTETLVGVTASETNRAPQQCACPYYSPFMFTWQLKWFM